jgi:hypothetical protein
MQVTAAGLRRLARRIHNSSTKAVAIGTPQRPGDAATKTVTVLPGQGIGPELCAAAMKTVRALGAPLEFEIIDNIVDKVRGSNSGPRRPRTYGALTVSLARPTLRPIPSSTPLLASPRSRPRQSRASRRTALCSRASS